MPLPTKPRQAPASGLSVERHFFFVGALLNSSVQKALAPPETVGSSGQTARAVCAAGIKSETFRRHFGYKEGMAEHAGQVAAIQRTVVPMNAPFLAWQRKRQEES